MTKHTFLPTSNVEASQKEYLIASKFMLSSSDFEHESVSFWYCHNFFF